MQLDELYRRVIMDHYQRPRNRGKLDEHDGLHIELNNPTCGDRIELQLKLDGNRVDAIRFDGEGCSISLASASMMTEAVKGLSVEEALSLAQQFYQLVQGHMPEDVDLGDLEALHGVSKFPARIKCATLAWKAMEQALKEAGAQKQEGP